MRTQTAACLIGIAFTAAAAGAEQTSAPLSTLVEGDRVKVKVAGNRETLTGAIESVTADQFVLKPLGDGGPLRLTLSQLQSLEVARGQKSQWLKGGLIGFIPGAILGGIAGAMITCDPYATSCNPEPGLAITGAFFLGAAGGAATGSVGALIGLLFKTDRWVKVHDGKPKVSFNIAPGKGEVSAGLSVSF